MCSRNIFNLGPCQGAGGPATIVHVRMHDPAVRRCHFFSAGHAAGISGHARPEYSPELLQTVHPGLEAAFLFSQGLKTEAKAPDFTGMGTSVDCSATAAAHATARSTP